MTKQAMYTNQTSAEDFEPMKCLVTGGAGFIGSHLVSALSALGHDVVVVDNLSTGLKANVPTNVMFKNGNVGDSVLLREVLPGCHCVFHLAAVSSVQASIDHAVAVNNDNLTATLALLEASTKHDVRRFVFSSSAAVYGDTNGVMAHEDMPPNPLSPYAVQKIASEYYCRVYAQLHGLETVSLRYFNVFGRRQRADSPYCGAIPRFLEAAMTGRAPTVFGDGSQTRDFCSVDDVVRANVAASQQPADNITGKVFNIGSGHAVSINEVLKELKDIFPSMPQPQLSSARVGEVQYSCADIRLASDLLGYRPRVHFRTALRDFALHSSEERLGRRSRL
jgi:nucleoside-diphosphate-sugar epimerase